MIDGAFYDFKFAIVSHLLVEQWVEWNVKNHVSSNMRGIFLMKWSNVFRICISAAPQANF